MPITENGSNQENGTEKAEKKKKYEAPMIFSPKILPPPPGTVIRRTRCPKCQRTFKIGLDSSKAYWKALCPYCNIELKVFKTIPPSSR